MQYMLDTNTISYLVRGNENIRQKIQQVPAGSCCISVVTEAELRFGLAKKDNPKNLSIIVHELFLLLPSLVWDSATAESYALLRAKTEKLGITIGNMDMLIAAHAYATNSILVTNDKALKQLEAYIKVEDWAE